MRKMVKNGLLALLLVLLSVCLVSCGGNDPSNPTSDPTPQNQDWSGMETITQLTDTVCYTVTDGKKTFSFSITKQGAGYCIVMMYVNVKVQMDEFYFNNATLSGSSGVFGLECNAGAFTGTCSASSKESLKEKLPSTDTWTIQFTNNGHSDRNVSYTIPKMYVNRIKEWIDVN